MPPRVRFVEKWADLSEDLAKTQNDKPLLSKQDYEQQKELLNEKKDKFNAEIVWRNVILMSALHFGALVGIYLAFVSAQWKTVVFAYLLYIAAGLGITAGAHRLWSHRSYKAKWPLRLILALYNTIAFQNSIYEWTRDHRVHHKYCETDADPHDARRGFFFSHVGWLLCRKHPEVKNKGKLIDMSDIMADPIVRFQKRYYLPLIATFCFLLPTIIPYILWNETMYNAFYVCALLRYCFTLHITWFVNSAAHMWGRKPYDKHIMASENRGVSLGALGEGFHNYHHVFPWDYATSELGYELNITKVFIDFFASVGWAYERKKASPEMIKGRKLRTGDVDEHGQYGSSHY